MPASTSGFKIGASSTAARAVSGAKAEAISPMAVRRVTMSGALSRWHRAAPGQDDRRRGRRGPAHADRRDPETACPSRLT